MTGGRSSLVGPNGVFWAQIGAEQSSTTEPAWSPRKLRSHRSWGDDGAW
jgi:hypothetical protein